MADGQHGEIVVEPKSYATLWLAFAAAQAAMPELLKQKVVSKQGTSAKGKEFSMTFKYAPLDVVLRVATPALHACGLMLTQPTHIEDGQVVVETRITHAGTGEAMSASYPVGPVAKPHPDLGAALTFARRYSLMSLLGIFPEGEDAPKPDKKPREQSGGADLTQAAATLRVKLTGAVSEADLRRIWNANQRLVDRLDREHPEAHLTVSRLFDERVLDLNNKTHTQGGQQTGDE